MREGTFQLLLAENPIDLDNLNKPYINVYPHVTLPIEGGKVKRGRLGNRALDIVYLAESLETLRSATIKLLS